MHETILDRLAKRAPRKVKDDDMQLNGEIKKLLSKIKKNISKHKNVFSTRGGLISMGARGPVLKEPGIYDRRVIVKVSYTTPDSRHARTLIRHHLMYAAQNKNDELNKSPELYTHNDEKIDFKERISELQKSPHIFNIIISPEDGDKLNLKEFTRDFVSKIEQDLGTKLYWAAGNHYDTNDPHVHLLIKGQDDTGRKLLMKPDYIARGLRARASQVATRTLGLRPWEEVVKSIYLDVNKPKKIVLDTIISRLAKDGSCNLDRAGPDCLNDLPKNLFKARLDYLQSKELVQKSGEHSWKIPDDLFAKLKEIGRTTSILEQLYGGHAANTQDCQIISVKNLPDRVIKGHIIERGYVDDHGDKQYLLIKSKEKQHVYVELEKYSEKSPAQVGEFVKVETTKAFSGPKVSDHTVESESRKNNHIYDAKNHEANVTGTNKLPPGVSAKEYVQVHINRLDVLARKGLVTKLSEGRFEIPKDYLNKIQQEAKKSQEKFTAHIKVVRLSPARLKTKSIHRGIRR